MQKYIILKIDSNLAKENPDSIDEVIHHSEKHYSKHSDLGVSFFEVVMTIGEFVVALLSLPFISENINTKKITIKFGGFELAGNVRSILNAICRDPEVLGVLRKAYYNNEVGILGDSQSAVKIYEEIAEFFRIEECMTNANKDASNG